MLSSILSFVVAVLIIAVLVTILEASVMPFLLIVGGLAVGCAAGADLV